MPWRCATNCATAPSGCPPKGRRRVYPCTRTRPNRPQGGLEPPCEGSDDDAFHVCSRHPAAPSRNSPSGSCPVHRTRAKRFQLDTQQPGDGRAGCRAVGRHDEAATRRAGPRAPPPGQPRPARARRPSTPRRRRAGCPRRAARRHARAATARRPRPLSGPARHPHGSRGTARPPRRGCRTPARRSAPSAAPGTGRRRPAASGTARRAPAPRHPPGAGPARTGVSGAGPADAGRVVGGLAVPQHDDAAGARRGVGRAHRPPCSVPTTPRSIVGQSFQSRWSP